ncbi:putative disease resistance RPP13-like protein 1 [Phaseolus vulgaris]|uniref:putative disease resistance RPP13-like protein 1 n=1 Tax=Phaseolus vulgaris TaxID=3885 RepID=UPI0035CB2974
MAAEFITNALVSTFLETTIDNLASRFGDIFRGKKANKKQLSILKVKLLEVDVVADDAEQKQFTDPRVRDWILAAKGVVFDAEDLLDEIDFALSKSQVEAQSQSTAKKVLNSLKSSFVSFFKENEIETRIEQVIEDLEDLATHSHVLGLKKADTVGVRSGSKLSSTYLPNDSEIYGREDDKQFVCNWLTSDTHNNLSILSIVGMGGVGKTTLAQNVFNDPRTDEAKFDVKAWVCVSDEFDVFKVSKAILEDVTTSTDDSRDTEMVHRRLKEKLLGKKFLLILDDVWNENQPKWEEVRKPLLLGAQGSKILVTTRSKEVASTMWSEEYSLQQLQEDDCWKLFAKHAFRDDGTQPNQECREIGMKIVKKCKGLPLALKTMGSLLYNKSSFSEWQTVFRSEIWEFSKERCDIIPALALSYIHLPSHLKVCFAYCALFPKDYEFKKEDLIKLWMTENFAQCRSHSKTSEEVCQQYFNDLLSRSFFQPSSENEEVFIMHDLLHDLAKYVAGGLYFRCELDQTEKIQKITRHFSFELGYNKYFDVFGTLCNTKRLRTFMPKASSLKFLWRWKIKMPIHELFSKFKFIRILSLSYCSDLQDIPDSVANLQHLRSLDLTHTAIKRLTEKICLLSHLQILKLNYCTNLEELPSNLHLLTNLCRLEFKGFRVTKMPPHLGKLKNLKVVMDFFYVGHGRELGVQQLRELNLDGSLSILKLQNIENSLDALEADLKNKTHLVSLELLWEGNQKSVDLKKEEDIIENLQPSKNLKKLFISGYGGKRFPNWLLENSLWNMVSLGLVQCESCQRLPPLGLLPFLRKLVIRKLDGIVSIDGDFHGNNSSSFKSLETLEFSHMSRWEEWDCQAVTSAFPCLRQLSIRNCPKLKGQLPEQVVPLERLQIEDCQQLEASATMATMALDLQLCHCGKLQLKWATLKSLTMETSLLEIVGSHTFEHLEIYSPLKSISDDCVSLCTFPLDFFPTLRTLHLGGFGNLQMISQSPIHNHLEELTLKNCPKFESLPRNMNMLLPSLKRLWIEDCPRLELFPGGGLPSNLEVLTIKDYPKLESFPDISFPSNLQSLTIEGCSVLESFPNGGFPSNLHTLTIGGCSVLESFPHGGFPSNLRNFTIKDCPRLKSLPDRGFPSNLKRLRISNCSRLVGSLKGAFTDSSSLERLWIQKVDAECFPDEGLLPLSLTSLIISDCPNLEKLDYKGLHQLSSLLNLNLINCFNLQRLPEEGLPKSISSLDIRDCPLLQPRCQRERGEDWEKIKHIRRLYIPQ